MKNDIKIERKDLYASAREFVLVDVPPLQFLMIDGSGNDFYRAESLAQGAAAQQSRAWLFDAGGNDAYWSSVDSAQGAATDNDYHFLSDDPVTSLGVLFDAGGDDRYSTGLTNGAVRIRHASGNADSGRGNSGVAIDESP